MSTNDPCLEPTVAETLRFWSKVAVTPSCWVWTAYRTPDGYGRFQIGKRYGAHRTFAVHRLSYELTTGPRPTSAAIAERAA